jgi:cathepsin B
MGSLPGGEKLPELEMHLSDEQLAAIPTDFDSRKQWGASCPSTLEVRDQANCGSCWAFVCLFPSLAPISSSR